MTHPPRRRRLVFLAVAFALLPACDGEPTPVVERSVLSLLEDLPEQGRYEVSPAERGRFWKVAGGDVVTRADPFDGRTVRREVGRLRSRIDAMVREAEASPRPTDLAPRALLLLADNRYEGRDFQYPFSAVVREAMGPLAEPVSSLIGRARKRCGDALDAHRARVDRVIGRLRPAFRGDVWTIETEPLGMATQQSRLDAVEACGADEDGTTTPSACALRIERTATTVTFRPLPYCEFDPADPERPSLDVTVRDAAVGPRPTDLEPVSAFDPVSRFRLKVDECGALPWEYSDFAAADTYTPPDDEDYLGPTFFVSHYLCESEVPPDRREEARRADS